MSSYDGLSHDPQPTKIAYINGKPDTVHVRKIHLQVGPGLEDSELHRFDQASVTMGLLAENDLVLSDQTVSRVHCRIYQEGEHYILEDLNSTNGTFINGVRVRQAYLEPGAVIGAGNSQIRFDPVDEQIPVRPSHADRLGNIVGTSVKMREIFDIIEKIAPTAATVVVGGETGTGKEVVAQTIHQLSDRSAKPFTVFDCGAVPPNLIESELFGHEKGSFTGAVMARKGLFETAQGGTIFLDELGELALDLQPKLLRVLEQREVRRVGSNTPIPVDVRVIAATNRDLEQEVREGRFREDLFYRLSVVRLTLPRLAERREDIPLLTRHFLDSMRFNQREDGGLRVDKISREALDALANYDWPGNVRELVNIVERACSFAQADCITPADLPAYITGSGHDGPLGPLTSSRPGKHDWQDIPARAELREMPFKQAKDEWISTFEKDYVTTLLVRHGGNISSAAREADIDRKYFRKLMYKHDVVVDDLDD